MARSRPRQHLLLLILAAALMTAPGCDALKKDKKFRHTISHTERQPPTLVVSIVAETLRDLNLKIISRNTTNIDGRFLVRSALGIEFQIEVQGIRTDKTRIQIAMPRLSHRKQAKLILAEVLGRLETTDMEQPR